MGHWPVRGGVIVLGPGTPPAPGSGGPDPPPPPPAGSWSYGIQRYGSTPVQICDPTAWPNLPLPPNAAIDPITPSVQSMLVTDSPPTNAPYFGTWKYSLPAFTVTADHPRQPILLNQSKWAGTVPNYAVAMFQVLLNPGFCIPPGFTPQPDSDSELIVVERDGNRAQEYWRIKALDPAKVTTLKVNGVTTNFTGIFWTCQSFWNVSTLATHKGRSRSHNTVTYPNAPGGTAADPWGTTVSAANLTKRLDYEDTNMSVAAAKLPFVPMTLTEEDVLRYIAGTPVAHPLNFAVWHPQTDSIDKTQPNNGFWWPASASDGYVATSPIREGMLLRLPPDYVINTSTHILCQIVQQIARDYGLRVCDKAGSLELDAEANVDPYRNGVANSQILNGFPWGQLQVVAMGSDAQPIPTA
jgi:hypothetical protein